MKNKLKLRDYIAIGVALIINTFILVIACYRTEYSISLPGGLTRTDSILDISDTETSGSFETVYVISFNRSTIFQNFIVDFVNSSDKEEMSENSLQFSDFEYSAMGDIQHDSSVAGSIISAYTEASKVNPNVNLDYTIDALLVSYYEVGQPFKIGDRITKVNGETITERYSGMTIDSGWLRLNNGDIITLFRNNQEITLTVSNDTTRCYCYPNYNINYDTLTPSVNIRRGYTGGPSGGMMRALSLYNDLIDEDLTKGLRIVGTGTISQTGAVGSIGSIRQKIYTAARKNADIFLCPSSNYEEALAAYNEINTDMKLYQVSTLEEAIEVLRCLN